MKALSFIGPALLMVTVAGCNARNTPSDAQGTQSSSENEVVYAATDSTINSDVKAKLTADENVGPMALDAQTQNKVVTLTGTLDSRSTEDKAMMVARQVNGVSSVVDNMKVGGLGCCNHKGESMQGRGDGMGMQHGPRR